MELQTEQNSKSQKVYKHWGFSQSDDVMVNDDDSGTKYVLMSLNPIKLKDWLLCLDERKWYFKPMLE